MGCKRKSLDKYLHEWFYAYAGYVERHWPYFLVVPLLLSAPCCIGFAFLRDRRAGKYETTEYMFTPTNADAIYERACIAEHWPLDPTRYLPGRSSEIRRWIEVLIV